jgi:taurine dioxygenase
MSITVNPLTPTLGAEIEGVDVTNMSDAQFQELFQAFTNHSVIFLRDQPALTPEQHSSFARLFGEIHVHPAARGKKAEFPGVIDIRTTESTRVAAGNRWHSDVSCDALPPQASILQLQQIPSVGGDTLFASSYAAYEALSDRMKSMLDGLTAQHSGEEPFRHLFKFNGSEAPPWPEHDHPIVRKHGDSKQPVLYVDREFTKCINDLPKEEGKSLLEFLFDHSERADFQCRFRWSPNAIAIWDNRCVLHHAMWDYWPQERRGQRISVVGEQPLPWRLGIDKNPSINPVTVKLTA